MPKCWQSQAQQTGISILLEIFIISDLFNATETLRVAKHEIEFIKQIHSAIVSS